MPETFIVHLTHYPRTSSQVGCVIPFLSGLAVAIVAAIAMSLLIDRMRKVRSPIVLSKVWNQNRRSQRPKRISESTGNLLIVVTAIVSFAIVFIWLM